MDNKAKFIAKQQWWHSQTEQIRLVKLKEFWEHPTSLSIDSCVITVHATRKEAATDNNSQSGAVDTIPY